MARFNYRAKDWSGKLIKGALEATSVAAVLVSIKESGLVPLSVEKESTGVIAETFNQVTKKVGLKQISSFTRQLSTMMTAGLAITDALALLKDQAQGGKMSEIMENCVNAIKEGKSLGSSLEKYKSIFGEAYVASINAGEEGGVLEEVLAKLADNLENQAEFNGKVKGAMIYPAIVILGMIGVTIVMMIFVIPKLTSLYADFGTAKLPAATKLLMSMSDWTAKLWFLFPLVIFGTISVLKAGDKNEVFRYKKDQAIMRIPILGELTKKSVVANSARTLSMLLTAGISLVEALKISSNVADNEVYRQAYVKIAERVEKGFSVANSFEEQEVFPLIVNQMVATGEATGKLDEVLMKVANYFSTEAEQSVKSLTSAIEPLIMIVLGVGVAFLVIAVIMPIYNLTSSF